MPGDLRYAQYLGKAGLVVPLFPPADVALCSVQLLPKFLLGHLRTLPGFLYPFFDFHAGTVGPTFALMG